MTVKELIEKLKKFDEHAKVVFLDSELGPHPIVTIEYDNGNYYKDYEGKVVILDW